MPGRCDVSAAWWCVAIHVCLPSMLTCGCACVVWPRQGWEGTFGAVMGYIDSLVPDWAVKLLAPLVAKLTGDLGEYGQEIIVRSTQQRPLHCVVEQCAAE